MKTKILLFFFLTIPLLLSAQNNKEHKQYSNYHFKNIEWGNHQYDNSIRGVILLLEDIEKVDPTLYLKLNEKFETYESNRKRGNRSIGIGAIGGVGFGILALNSYDFYEEKRAVGFLFIGLVIFLGGMIVGKKRKISERKFIYQFTNFFNKNAEGEKVKYSVRPDINLGNNSSVGLAFSVNF
ncbi:MAG: hypothetical protein ACJAT4_001695 [Granulosicoccus sp.]|jgi:hypothetical protein